MATEPTISRLAAERRTDEQLAAITEAFARMSRAEPGKPFVDADSEFHALIATAAHNVLLSFSMLPTMSLLEEVRVKIVEQPSSVAASQAEHQRILTAIGASDGDAAEQAMRDHITWFQDRGSAVARRAGR